MTASIAIVTDSTADIPPDLAAQYQVHIVPNLMVIAGKSYEDGAGISREEFYRRLPGMKEIPTTATASAGTYEALYESLLNQGAKHVISIHAPAALSGIMNAASAAAIRFEERIKVLDSGQLSLGLGFQALAAAEAALRGATIDQVLHLLESIYYRARVVAMLDTLEYVRRSGRVSWARARLGNLLSIKPFVEVQHGKVLSIGETRTRRKGIERLRHLLIQTSPLERLGILHSNAEADALAFLDELKFQLELPALVPVVNITTIVGVHVGPSGLGFAAIAKS
ncbi:MAG: DegV family protein [Anaerolineales bacterium]|jgi:DegV family protein with EDD domain|nr:DegV family protein [Anaerolineales bacterium]